MAVPASALFSRGGKVVEDSAHHPEQMEACEA